MSIEYGGKPGKSTKGSVSRSSQAEIDGAEYWKGCKHDGIMHGTYCAKCGKDIKEK